MINKTIIDNLKSIFAIRFAEIVKSLYCSDKDQLIQISLMHSNPNISAFLSFFSHQGAIDSILVKANTRSNS